MRRRQRSFGELVTRSLATAGLLYALVFAYAVPAYLLNHTADLQGPVRPDVSALTRPTAAPGWTRARAEQFPGCIDMAEWRASRVPATVVVVRRDGGLERMSFEEAYRRARSASAADDVLTIGACV